MNYPQHIVIVGGGFAGLHAALHLGNCDSRVTLIDRCNHHLFQPLLYQAATGALSPANIAAPLRSVLKRYKNIEVLMEEVLDFDLESKEVLLSECQIHFDTLIVAAGAENFYYGNSWEENAPGLKTLEDAVEIRRRVFSAFEEAERKSLELRGEGAFVNHSKQKPFSSAEADPLLTFVVIGGGPTGVELAGALHEIARDTLRHDFRGIDPQTARIILVEGQDRVLGMLDPELSEATQNTLEKLGVVVKLNTMVKEIAPGFLVTEQDGKKETILANTVLWAAGVKASHLGARLAEAAGVKVDRMGRIPVDDDLSIPGHEDLFILGDMARCADSKGRPLPGIAPVAIQQGEYVARLIRRRLRNRKPPAPFRYRNYGVMATIGRLRAVAQIGPLRLKGLFAWLAWLFIHLMYLVQFQNRVLVFMQWTMNFLTWNRSARLITEKYPQPVRIEEVEQETVSA